MIAVGKLEVSKSIRSWSRSWNIEYGRYVKLGCGVWLEHHRVFAEKIENSLYWIDQRR